MTASPGLDEPMLLAAVDMVRRTGATTFQLRYSDEESPVVWVAAAEYSGIFEVAAGLAPVSAVLRLCERLIDGGQCQHCGRPSGFSESVDDMPADRLVCWYQWDPELATFRRSCEGSDR